MSKNLSLISIKSLRETQTVSHKSKSDMHIYQSSYLGQSKSSVVSILFSYRKLKQIFLFSYSDREKNALFFYAI